MMSFFCHPVWSGDLEDYLDLDGYFSLEIYNHGCEMANRTGLAVAGLGFTASQGSAYGALQPMTVTTALMIGLADGLW